MKMRPLELGVIVPFRPHGEVVDVSKQSSNFNFQFCGVLRSAASI